MQRRIKNARILIYSHDTFGLGHLRRCRTIAQFLVSRIKGLSVLILSGSPIIGSFEYRTRADFVRIPGVIKLRNGEYSALSLHMDIEEVLHMRASIIRHTADAFSPDIFLVDKEPLGLRAEIQETLCLLKDKGTRLVLGLRDVIDEPAVLAREWKRKNPVPALRDLYDDILVYGLPQIRDPLAGLSLPRSVHKKVIYTGYLRGSMPGKQRSSVALDRRAGSYVLVTAGGGGDGEALIDWVLSAYESQAELPHRALLVFGPFMAPEARDRFKSRVDRLERVCCTTFDTQIEQLMADSAGVVTMGGYNTFCESLTLGKPTLSVPLRGPRKEQHIRISRAAELGLVRMLSDDGHRDPAIMAQALRDLVSQPSPPSVVVPGLLDGLDNILELVESWLTSEEELPRLAAAGQ